MSLFLLATAFTAGLPEAGPPREWPPEPEPPPEPPPPRAPSRWELELAVRRARSEVRLAAAEVKRAKRRERRLGAR